MSEKETLKIKGKDLMTETRYPKIIAAVKDELERAGADPAAFDLTFELHWGAAKKTGY